MDFGILPRLPALPSRRLPIEVAMRFAGRPSHDRPRELKTQEPEPGYFVLHQVRDGPWVPATIWRPCPLILPEPWRHGAGRLLEETPGPEDWCMPIERARPLRARIGDKQKAYAFRMARRDWAVTFAPAQPEANPRKPVVLAKLPSLF